MKYEEKKNDLLLNEESMTQLGFSEEVKQYVRERKNLYLETLRREDKDEFEKRVADLGEERSLIRQFKDMNNNLVKTHSHYINLFREVKEVKDLLEPMIVEFKSLVAYHNDSFIRVMLLFISILLMILITVTWITR